MRMIRKRKDNLTIKAPIDGQLGKERAASAGRILSTMRCSKDWSLARRSSPLVMTPMVTMKY